MFFLGHVAFHGHFSIEIIIQPSLALGFRYPGTSSPAVAVSVGSDKESIQNDPRNQNKTTTVKTPSPIFFDFEMALYTNILATSVEHSWKKLLNDGSF